MLEKILDIYLQLKIKLKLLLKQMLITIQKKFFTTPKLIHKVSEIMNKNWVNIYDLFLKEKKIFIWPRGFH